MSRDELSQHSVKIVMAVLGLSHAYNTKVGNDFIQGVSGGERKRVSISEMMLSGSPLCAWDNRYCQKLISSCVLTHTALAVSIQRLH